MSDDEDEWVENAMTNDSLVAHLLLRLKLPRRPPRVPDRPPLNIDWMVRQRRSKSVPTQEEDCNNKTATERASPTTPLSWSGATCASGGAPDGFEESSRPAKTTNGSRSKVCCSSLFSFPSSESDWGWAGVSSVRRRMTRFKVWHDIKALLN